MNVLGVGEELSLHRGGENEIQGRVENRWRKCENEGGTGGGRSEGLKRNERLPIRASEYEVF